MKNGIAIADGSGGWVCDRCGRTGKDPTAPQPPTPESTPQRCRECGEGKHGACNGTALVDDGRDVLEVDCICASGGHA
jgi:hypothetical protein